MFSFLSGKTKDADAPPDEQRALPASWYHSGPLYDLERRAIFSRKWLLVTHRLRFQKAGDYVSFQEAGFSFFLIQDRQGNINGFHNICRHRAFPIVEHDSGTARILSCRYHGWSYGFKGNLAKAPRFDKVSTFDKAQHSLFSIHVHIDRLGLVWVNMDAAEKPEIPWEDDFGGVDTQDRLRDVDLDTQYRYDHQWSMVGDYNWKTLADNYNECYHCATGHPAVAAVADLQHYHVDTQKSYILHFGKNKEDTADVFRVASTFVLPNASFTVTDHFFFLQRCVPLSANQTKMEYEIYRRVDATDEDFMAIDAYFKCIMQEDKELCNGAQRNLESGVFVNGQLHPQQEQGPLFFQDSVRKTLMDFRKREERENNGEPIWPATRKNLGSAATRKYNEEEKFCAGLEAGLCPGVLGAGEEVLSW